jgi:hypothetical protein
VVTLRRVPYPIGEEIISVGDAELFRAMMQAGIIRRLS